MKVLFRLLLVVLCGISLSSYSQTTESSPGQLILEAADQVYVGDELLIKVKLPANAALALFDIPVTLIYQGKDGSNTLMSVIPEGHKEAKFNIPTSKAGSLTISVEAPGKSYLTGRKMVSILQTYQLVFVVADKDYGGANIAVKVNLPDDAPILEDIPVTLVYSEHANGTLEGVIQAGTKELLFNVPTTQVKGNNQLLNLALNVERPFIAPAQKRITILQAQRLIWEVESQVYGGNDVPVTIKIPANVEAATQATAVSLTYDGPVSGTLIGTIPIGANQVTFTIPIEQLMDDLQELTFSAAVTNGPFLAPFDKSIVILPSLKESLELHVDQTRIYGGEDVTLKITLSVPLGRENLLEDDTVTLSYFFEGGTTTRTLTIPKGASQVPFQIPIARLGGNLDKELTISTAETKHFLASDPITITIRAADAPQYEWEVATSSVLGGTPFMVKVKIPSPATESIPVELDWDDDQDDLFEVPDDIVIEAGQTEVAFDVLPKKIYGDDKIVSLLPIVAHFKDPAEWNLVILQSGEQAPEMESQTTDSKVIQVYGGTNVSVPVSVEVSSCSANAISALSLIYQGAADDLVGSKTKSVKLDNNKSKFNIRINANMSTEDRLLTVSTNDDAVSAMTKNAVVIRVLRKGKAKLDLSVSGSSNPKIYSQEHSVIPVKLTIPKNAVNDLNASTIRLNYSANASRYIELIPSVTLEAGSSELAFDLRIKKFWDTPQLITVTATHKEGNFIFSDPLNIQLSKWSLELSGRDSKSNSYSSGNLNPINIYGGEYMALKVRISARTDEGKRTINVPVTITYAGDGADFIQDPVKSITLDPNNDEGTIWMKVKNIIDVNPKKLRIQASASEVTSSQIFDCQLNKNVEILLKNSNTTISLPPLPKLNLGRDNKVEVSTSESIYRCAEPLKGFWVSFRLQGKVKSNDQVYIETDKISKTFDPKNSFSNQFASIWIPLKKDIQKDNNSYYWITTSYQPGEHHMLSPGSSTSASYDATYSVNTNLVYTNEKGEVNKESKQGTNSGSHGGSLEMGLTVNAGLGIEGVAMAKKSLSVAIKAHKEWSWSDVTGTVNDVSLSSQFKDELGQSKTDKYRVSLTRTGPPVGFNRVFVPIYPKIAYAFGDPSNKNTIPLASYIDFSVFGSSVSRDLTLVDFINHVFKTNGNGELINLEKYLIQYKEQLTGAADETLKKISKTITDHTDKIGNITAHDYAVGIINSSMQGREGVTPQELHIDVPIDCDLNADVKIDQFFKRLPDGLNACFMFKNLPYSAAETELKIIRIDRNGKQELVHQRSEPRDVDANYKEPLTELSNVLFELENNGSYKAYLRYRCARGQWSKQYEQSFTLDRLACSIPENSISASPLPGGGIKVTWAAPSGGAAGYYVEYSTGGNTFETVKGNSSSYSSSHRFDIPLPGESYTYMGSGEVSFRITPACRLGNGASLVFRYRVSGVCKAPPAPKVGPNANKKRLLFLLDHDGNPYLDGYTIQVRKGGDPWTAVEREYRSIKQKYSASNRAERIITDVESDFFKPDIATADKDRVRIARVKATCSDGETVWSQDSAPFDVSFLVNKPELQNVAQKGSTQATSGANIGISLSSAYNTDSSTNNEPIFEPELRIFPNCIEGSEIVFSILRLQEIIKAADIYVFKVNGAQSSSQTVKLTALDIFPGQSIHLQAPVLAHDNANGMYVLHIIPQQRGIKPMQQLFCKQD